MPRNKRKKKLKPSSTSGSITTRNPVAKHAGTFNKASTHIDRKKEAKKRGNYEHNESF